MIAVDGDRQWSSRLDAGVKRKCPSLKWWDISSRKKNWNSYAIAANIHALSLIDGTTVHASQTLITYSPSYHLWFVEIACRWHLHLVLDSCPFCILYAPVLGCVFSLGMENLFALNTTAAAFSSYLKNVWRPRAQFTEYICLAGRSFGCDNYYHLKICSILRLTQVASVEAKHSRWHEWISNGASWRWTVNSFNWNTIRHHHWRDFESVRPQIIINIHESICIDD